MLTIYEEAQQLLSPPRDVMVVLKKRADDLRMLPDVAIEAMNIAKKPNCSIAEFAAVVERDVKLASDVLRIANSALYCPATPILNLHRAVVRLGFRECQNLIMAASLASLMNRISLEEEWIRGALWRHSFNTALLSLHLNQAFHLGFQGEEFTAGLIHDFGRTLLAVAVPDRFSEADPMDFDETPEILVREDAIVGTDHCRLGAWYAVQQQLPAPLPEVILLHHRPEAANHGRRLAALVAVADHMANHLQQFEGPAGYDPSANLAFQVLSEFVDGGAARRFSEIAPTLMEETVRDAEILMMT